MNPRTIRLLCVCFALAFSSTEQAAPASVKPELQAWQKKVFDAIGTRWYHNLQKYEALVRVGSTRISFRIMADGRIKNLKIISNTSNEGLREYLHSVRSGCKNSSNSQERAKRSST